MQPGLRIGAPDGDTSRFRAEWDLAAEIAWSMDGAYYRGSRYLPDALMLVEALRRTSVVGLAPCFSHNFFRPNMTAIDDPLTAGDDLPDAAYEAVPVFMSTGWSEYDIYVGYAWKEECPRVAVIPDAAGAAARLAELIEHWWAHRAGRPVRYEDRPWEAPDRWRGPAGLKAIPLEETGS